MSIISIKNFLDAGVHFGHQASKWNPKMSKYIFTVKNGIHILNLDLTLKLAKDSCDFIYDNVSKHGSKILFVATKKNMSNVVMEYANKCSQFYIVERWLGGTLTNFLTIKRRIHRLKKLEKMDTDNAFDSFTKKEKSGLVKEKDRLSRFLGGIKYMDVLPDIMVVFDINKDIIAVQEANAIGIPVIGLSDSNVNPELLSYPIPSNDDAIKVITLFMQIFSDVIIKADAEFIKNSNIAKKSYKSHKK